MSLKQIIGEVHSSFSWERRPLAGLSADVNSRRWVCVQSKHIPVLLLLAACLIPRSSAIAATDSPIIFGGASVDLKISEIDVKTVRIELHPLEGSSDSAPPSWTLSEFPAKERFHSRDLSSEKKLRIGDLR